MNPLDIAEEVLGALIKTVGVEGIISLVEKIVTAKNDPQERAALTAAGYAATDAALDSEEAQKLAEISAETRTP